MGSRRRRRSRLLQIRTSRRGKDGRNKRRLPRRCHGSGIGVSSSSIACAQSQRRLEPSSSWAIRSTAIRWCALRAHFSSTQIVTRHRTTSDILRGLRSTRQTTGMLPSSVRCITTRFQLVTDASTGKPEGWDIRGVPHVVNMPRLKTQVVSNFFYGVVRTAPLDLISPSDALHRTTRTHLRCKPTGMHLAKPRGGYESSLCPLRLSSSIRLASFSFIRAVRVPSPLLRAIVNVAHSVGPRLLRFVLYPTGR